MATIMENSRERDLVLAPNEYAFISDQTKGHIVAYVGPYKTSMANTDKPVTFDKTIKRFKICSLEDSIQTFTTAPEGWYVELKNPSHDGNQPKLGTANSQPTLEIGRKVNIPGPVFFALWPGQMARITQGHRLRSNQYLLVRVYDDEQAQKNWNKAVIKPQKNTANIAEVIVEQPVIQPVAQPIIPTAEGVVAPVTPITPAPVAQTMPIPELTLGQLIVIKGTDVSYYIPPTGIEVVRDDHGNYVREAVTLERLEYCILLDENGNKRFIKGTAVVFPEPTEALIVKDGQVKFKAIELNEISGIYVKVIAPYEEDGKKYEIGEELFISGKEMIYFPRPEHALIRYGERDVYHAVAIPAGEGRYFLNRKTGKVSLQKGPCMFLPDPREAVIVKRILSSKQVELWFPNNREALEYNQKLQELAEKDKKQDFVIEQQSPQMQEQSKSKKQEARSTIVGDNFSRSQSHTAPRTITLDSKYEGSVMVDVWTGYAVLVTSKTGDRKVIVGPQSYLLEYEENLQGIELSTGTPKTDTKTVKTVYLRTLHNKISDLVEAETKDFCKVNIKLSYRVNFTGENSKWFDVENYVKFLTDHLRSVIRNAMQKYNVMEFYTNGISILRDIILGKAVENGKRAGRLFEENGMLIYDVEILDIAMEDEVLSETIYESQHEEIKHKLAIEGKQRELEFARKTEEMERAIAAIKSLTITEGLKLKAEEASKQLALNLVELETTLKTQEKELQGNLAAEETRKLIGAVELEQRKADKELNLEIEAKNLALRLQELKAEVEAVASKAGAVSPDLIAALQAFSDKALAEKMAETMAPLSIIGGKSIAEVFANLLKGTVLENVLRAKSLEE